jgi:hypothetical protein
MADHATSHYPAKLHTPHPHADLQAVIYVYDAHGHYVGTLYCRSYEQAGDLVDRLSTRRPV